MDGGRPRRPPFIRYLSYIKNAHKNYKKMQKAYMKTYEKDVKLYKDIENYQGTLLLQKCPPLYHYSSGESKKHTAIRLLQFQLR